MRSRFELQAAAQEAEYLVSKLRITTLPVDPFHIAEEYDIDLIRQRYFRDRTAFFGEKRRWPSPF